jgi:hypothetical protein
MASCCHHLSQLGNSLLKANCCLTLHGYFLSISSFSLSLFLYKKIDAQVYFIYIFSTFCTTLLLVDDGDNDYEED